MSKAVAAIPNPVILVPLDKLYVAPENPRFESEAQDVRQLADNIFAFGLLQPLLAYEAEKGFAVVGGKRRLAALAMLMLEKRVPGSGAFSWSQIPVREIAQEDAIGVGLAENTERIDLSVAEAAEQWNRMLMRGATADNVAKSFGVSERFVLSRVRLANLHPPIFAALKQGEISIDLAQCYAGALRSMNAPQILDQTEAQSAYARDVVRKVLDSGFRAACLVLGDRTLSVKQIAAKMLIEDFRVLDAAAAGDWLHWIGTELAATSEGEKNFARACAFEAFATLARAEIAKGDQR